MPMRLFPSMLPVFNNKDVELAQTWQQKIPTPQTIRPAKAAGFTPARPNAGDEQRPTH